MMHDLSNTTVFQPSCFADGSDETIGMFDTAVIASGTYWQRPSEHAAKNERVSDTWQWMSEW
jgi:hypothetical protein